MFLHLGSDLIVCDLDIIAILDLESATSANSTRDFIKNLKNTNTVVNICQKGKEKSLVITKKTIYLSPISSNTLLKRANNNYFYLETD